MNVLRVAVIQVGAGRDGIKNERRLKKLLNQARRKKPHLIALPEAFAWRGPSRQLVSMAKELTPRVVSELQKFSKQHRIAMLLGSVMEEVPRSTRKVYNTSLLISETGRIVSRYRKIHLFDSGLKGARTRESKDVASGKKIVLGKIRGIGLGLTVCYDLRFPELYRTLSKRGARILFVPANFTYKTGVAHWEVLLRARAIENQCFVVAPGQVGVSPSNKIRSFGTSLMIGPWGEVLARASRNREEVVFAKLDLRRQAKLRKAFPVLEHRRVG